MRIVYCFTNCLHIYKSISSIWGKTTGLLQVDDEAMELNKELMSQLLELDDVDAVYTDQKWSKSLSLVIISAIELSSWPYNILRSGLSLVSNSIEVCLSRSLKEERRVRGRYLTILFSRKKILLYCIFILGKFEEEEHILKCACYQRTNKRNPWITIVMLGNDFHSSFCKRALILLTLFNLTAKKKEFMERKAECGNHLHNIVLVMENVNGVALNYT